MTVAHPDPVEAGRENTGRERHPLMTVIEVAAALRVSKATVYRLVRSGALPGRHMGRTVRISRRVVDDLLRDDTEGPETVNPSSTA